MSRSKIKSEQFYLPEELRYENVKKFLIEFEWELLEAIHRLKTDDHFTPLKELRILQNIHERLVLYKRKIFNDPYNETFLKHALKEFKKLHTKVIKISAYL